MQDEAKRAPRSRDWVGTIYSEEEPVFHVEFDRYLRFVRENCPETGRRHYQCNFVFLQPQSLRAIKRVHGDWHFEIRMGTFEQADVYCTLGKGRIPPDTTGILGSERVFGTPPAPGERSDLSATCDKFLAEGWSGVSNQHIVRYYKGLQFLRGVRFARKRRDKTVLFFDSKEALWKYAERFPADKYVMQTRGGWFDFYNMEPFIIVMDYDYQVFPIRELRALIDDYPYDLPVKGGFLPNNAHTILVHSQYGRDELGL